MSIFPEFKFGGLASVKLILGLRDASVARETDVVLANPGTELSLFSFSEYLEISG